MLLKISVTRFGVLLNFGQLFKAFATINFTKSPTFLGNFCKGVKIYHFSSENIFGTLLKTFGNFFLITLLKISCLIENMTKECFGTYPVSIHDTESLLELLDGTLGEHSEDIASALLGFPGIMEL